MIKHPTPDLVEPTIQDIVNFGKEIEINPRYLNYILVRLNHNNARWWHFLHDLGHFAVKSNLYNDSWWEIGRPGGIPNKNFVYIDGVAVHLPHPYWNSGDFTPNDDGVCAWSLLVLKHNKWINPLNSPDWPKDGKFRHNNNPYQWMPGKVNTLSHPLGIDGFLQLKAVGIDFERDILRPIVDEGIVNCSDCFG